MVTDLRTLSDPQLLRRLEELNRHAAENFFGRGYKMARLGERGTGVREAGALISCSSRADTPTRLGIDPIGK